MERLKPSRRDFLVGLGRGFAGSLIFSLPMLMTMEMWWLGFYADPLRLALFMTLLLPLLWRLSRYGGLRHTRSGWDDLADALVAVAIAAIASAVVLALFGVLDRGMSTHEVVGKLLLQTFCGSIGAMLAQNQFGEKDLRDERREAEASYLDEMFLMVVGALFLSLNMAPTEEIILIAYQMSVWQVIVLILLTLVLMHAFVYGLEFGGTERPRDGEGFWSVFARFTVAGYALVLLVSFYVLWTFGRLDSTGNLPTLGTTIVLGFPGALGAAVARLML
ncbi:TIGR02587 family membrane protein [Aureimonas leprariae]|uniref:TIGR02587 family membrane protein n=1 Tax=Plantimonas leprariae TaxID=2615207 RepID=A0A7V7PKD1_9HYPH|nr:TIGR02587 family membrane protein [Aureimonas leprariae]KAB0676217.1 TIGR02587 family membrane protein [Aureimonas leprariae]